ncbi:MAG: site-specific DNA-methyltransferase [Desulfobacteraceae bacterium]|nr:site-specific DNA-methyltransferase [Desulfobacteraceae bacterium]
MNPTRHRIHFVDATQMRPVPDASVHLTVTSPPYPMIQMWDEMFSGRSRSVRRALDRGDGAAAFESMHRQLDPVWAEVHRVLAPGGFACINIGDATRSVGDRFALYPNHVRILQRLQEIGFTPLPCILWRKQTNSPNKFLGSGMLPAGAYVTLEHEYILIARKGAKRGFANAEEKRRRRQSALFWEERNRLFSDVWFDLKGTPQSLPGSDARVRSGAFPLTLAYRLISMYSAYGDTVLDPFAGTGTTTAAAAAAARNSIGIEIDASLGPAIADSVGQVPARSHHMTRQRLSEHLDFLERRNDAEKACRHTHRTYGFPVVTAQETDLLLQVAERVDGSVEHGLTAQHRVLSPEEVRSFPTSVPS